MKQYIPKAEYDYELVEELGEGKSLRLTHYGCGGSGKNLSVTKDAGMVVGHCFKCKRIIAQRAGIKSLYPEWDKSKVVYPAIVSAPARCGTKTLEYLANYGLNHTDFELCEVSISDDSGVAAFRFMSPDQDVWDSDGAISAVVRNLGVTPGGNKWAYFKPPQAMKLHVIRKRGESKLVEPLSKSSVILVEDLLSAVKVSVATNENVACTFGTSIGADEMAYLITNFDTFYVWFDYDSPGITEGRHVTDSLRQFADARQICERSSGLEETDPKDFPRGAIRNIITEYYIAK